MMRASRIRITNSQSRFLSLPHKYRAFVGGFGSGKTYSGCLARCVHHLQFGRINSGYFAPTYPHIRDIFYPTIEEVSGQFDISIKIKSSDHEVHYFRGGRQIGTTICRSLDNPGKIIGFKIGDAMIDEFDTLPIDKALLAWRKIQARMRYKIDGLKNRVDVTTTPEGFMATHKLFVENAQSDQSLANSYGLVQASTYENAANLPDDYIPSLVESYPAELIQAYLHGQFVNLKSGTVYRSYNRVTHNSNETIRDKETLFIGMDFNVQHMAASVFVQRPNGWHAVAELKDIFDTPDMARIIKERWKDKGHRIIIYPDASGGSRKSSDASISDLSILRQSGFEIRVNNTNPAVKDRINSVNKQFELGKLWVNAKECKTIASCLEKQAYDDNGEPDKKSGFDHQCFSGDQIVNVNGVNMRFSEIPEKGQVFCPDGIYRDYINGGKIKDNALILSVILSNGRMIKCTPDHKFLTTEGWVCAENLTGKILVNRWLLAEVFKNIEVKDITYAGNTFKGTVLGFIEKFGRIITETFLRVSISITKMKTELIIQSQILNCSSMGNTLPCMEKIEQGCPEKQLTKLQNGTKVNAEKNGILSTIKRCATRYTKKIKNMCAYVAVKSIIHPEKYRPNTVQITAQQNTDDYRELIMRERAALYVQKYLSTISTSQRRHALENAPLCSRLEQLEKGAVYCLTVSDYGMFSIDNVIVSNCDSFGYPIAYEFPINKPVLVTGIGSAR